MSITRLGVGTRMSSIVIHQGTVYLCGQVAKDKYQDITEQTVTMLEEVDTLLAFPSPSFPAPGMGATFFSVVSGVMVFFTPCINIV